MPSSPVDAWETTPRASQSQLIRDLRHIQAYLVAQCVAPTTPRRQRPQWARLVLQSTKVLNQMVANQELEFLGHRIHQ
jgi:hypothetical protein